MKKVYKKLTVRQANTVRRELKNIVNPKKDYRFDKRTAKLTVIERVLYANNNKAFMSLPAILGVMTDGRLA